MPQASPWIALEAGADAEASARALSHVHEQFFGLAGEPAPAPAAGRLRSVISASWRRCARAGVTPRDHDVVVLDDAALRERRAASGLEPAVAAAVRLRALGTARATLEVGGRRVELSPRHSEIAVLLALHPDGLSAEELALELFGEDGKPVSVRAELSRLRRMLGPLLDARPYRLTVPVVADFDDVRGHVDAGVRLAVIAAEDDDLLRRWLESPAGRRDLPGLELLLRRRPRDPSLAPLGRRAARLRVRA